MTHVEIDVIIANKKKQKLVKLYSELWSSLVMST